MRVIINKAPEHDWQKMVADNLKLRNEVDLESFIYPDDLEICHTLANQNKAKVYLNADKTICWFTFSN